MSAPRITPRITPDMTLLDVVHAHPATEAVFRSYDAKAGACLLCTALFDSIETVAGQWPGRWSPTCAATLRTMKRGSTSCSTIRASCARLCMHS